VGNSLTDLMLESFIITTEKRMTKFASYFAVKAKKYFN